MVKEVIEARETLHAEKTPVRVTTDTPVEVSLVVIPSGSQKEEATEGFTREVFEGALDKVSRDEADVADARAELREKGEIPWEEVKRKHGL